MVKNPYNLVEKANNTFNLYLEKYDDIESYMNSSKNKQNEIKELISSFFNEYNIQQNKLNNVQFKFLKLIETMIEEDKANKELIKNLEFKINKLTDANDLNNESLTNLIENSNKQINETKKINHNLDHIKNDLTNQIYEISKDNQKRITIESNKQINEIQKINENFECLKDMNELSINNQMLITNELNKQNSETQKIDNNIKNIQYNITQKSEKQIDETRKIKEDLNQLKKNVDSTMHKISEENQKLITNESNKQITEIQKLNENHNIITNESNKQITENINRIRNDLNNKLNDLTKDHHNLITNESNKQITEIQKLNENQIAIKTLLDAQVDVNNNLNEAVKLFTQNYDECKQYFFNDHEESLKEHLDTDELFRLCYFNNMRLLSYSPTENKILLETKEGIIIGTNNRFYTIKEVIGFDGYSVPHLYQFNDFVVFDIGMNRAYASLRFAEFENCSAVYGFEIDPATFNKATYNINLNPKLSQKITPYNIGLSNENKITELYYLEGADGLNTLESEFVDIQYELRDNKDKIQTKTVEVKKASDVLKDIIEKENISSKIILKIDTEGSEYNILDDLVESRLIDKIDLILGEGHNFNNRNIANELLELGFKEIENKDNKIVYNFAFVRNEYYDIWPLRE